MDPLQCDRKFQELNGQIVVCHTAMDVREAERRRQKPERTHMASIPQILFFAFCTQASVMEPHEMASISDSDKQRLTKAVFEGEYQHLCDHSGALQFLIR